jgi:peptidoglycan/LPS O-acetylase OafA/YrhL
VLAQEIGHWLTFDAGPLLGFADAGRMVAFVPWSLRYEWVFYALVPVIGIAWAALGLRAWPVYAVSAMTLVLAVLPRDIPVLQINSMFLAPFALGGCAATIDRQSRLADILRGGWGVALVLLALALVFRTQVTAYAPVPFLLLACVFLPIALGNSVFGLLSSRPLQILGAISYDVYLVHGLVLYVAYTLLLPSALGDAGMLSSLVQLIVLGFVVIAVSIGLHRLVERPGERLGAYLARSGLRERLAAP